MDTINYYSLLTARRLRQKTQKEVAEAVGVSQAKLSKAENGLQELPEDVISNLADYYDLPLDFFMDPKDLTPVGHFYYRKKLTISDKLIDSFEAKIRIVKNIIDEIMSNIDIPEYHLTSYNDDEKNPSEIARKIRYELKIFQGPVRNLTSLLESNGIIIFMMDFGTDKIDGISSVTASNRKIIFLNTRMPNDRIRFSLAHELGHLVMHLERPPLSADNVEREADEFASEFLMPATEIKNDFTYLNFETLAQLKRKWGVSMRALVRRAKDLGMISDAAYRNMQINFSKRGYNKHEPVSLPFEPPTLIKDTLSLYKTELDYTDEELQKLMRIGKNDYKEWFTPRPRIVELHPMR
jgi:Zn-dependent peptidase ImmA (M78 family)